jgi:anti-sigma B factor antagonist
MSAASTSAATITDVGAVTVILPGVERIDIETGAALRQALQSVVRRGRQQLVVDLSDVGFMDSSGLSVLISGLKMVKLGRERRRAPRASPTRRPTVRGDVKLAALQPAVRSLLQIIRLDRVFDLHPSVEAAVASYGSAEP